MKETIIEYIPQRSPMVMIDSLIKCDEKTATTSLTISADNVFTNDKAFTEPGMIENIAQTSAAMVGYQCKLKNIPVPVGFIAAVKNWRLVALPAINSAIQTTIKVVNEVMDITIVEGTIVQNNQLLCSCEMRILVQKNKPQT